MPPRSGSANALTNRDPKVEHMLREVFKVNFALVTGVKPSQIDVERSRGNNARTQTLDEDTKRRYVEALKRDEVFPPIIAYRANRGTAKKYTVVDGNHRVAAHAERDKPLDVYELGPETPAATITMMTLVCNTRNGLGLTSEERIRGAVTLVDNGVTHHDAGSLMGVNANTLRRALAAREADRRATKAGINGRQWDTLPPSVRARLNSISTNSVLKLAAGLIYDAQLNANDVNYLVTELNRFMDESEARDFLRQRRKELTQQIDANAGGLARGTKSPKRRFAIAIGMLDTVFEDRDTVLNLYKGPERDELTERLEMLHERVAELLTACRSEE